MTSPSPTLAPDSLPPRWRTYLRLGRVSNLPTVWTNVLAGVALGGGPLSGAVCAAIAACASAAYVAGMLLNDAFDQRIDARERPERPIPAGHVSSGEVFATGFALLVASVVGFGLVASQVTPATWSHALLAGAILAGFIVLYDAWHKQNPLSPVVMGACRASVYGAAAFASGGRVTIGLVVGGVGIGFYVVGLTFVARQENRNSFTGYALLSLLAAPAVGAVWVVPASVRLWVAILVFGTWVLAAVKPLFSRDRPNVPRAVVRMIAGIALLDGLFLASLPSPAWLLAGPVGLALTLFLQRYVRGT